MKKFIFLLIIIGIITIFFSKKLFIAPQQQNVHSIPKPTALPTNTITPEKPVSSLFIPYWSVGTNPINDNDYDELIYFGVQATTTGINTDENGYVNIPKFLKNTDETKKRLLTVRMIDTNTDSKILNNKLSTQKVISDSISIAKQNKFDGIVLDLEYSALSFDSVVKSISTFEDAFDNQAKANDLSFDVLIYGDNFYRARPFDTKIIGEHADKLFIMAYDFSKANGIDPGPNFPLYGKETFGYDFTAMVDDFKKEVPQNKLSIVYGMYGYNWSVDNDNKSKGQAQSLTDNQINQLFYPTCNQTNCEVKNDEQSAETKITYQDHDGQKHTVWFENLNSAEKKQAYARSKGITNFAYWAYSYF